jgi:hypothetical protein
MKAYTVKWISLTAMTCCFVIGCTTNNRPPARQPSLPSHASPLQQLQRPISITGNVIAPMTAPKAVLKMALIQNSQSNLGVSWSWSTSSADYGSTPVPANYSVGLFIRNAQGQWFAFRVDAAASAQATWGQRIQRFHDTYAGGGIREPASRIVESGTWCVTLAAASTPETGGSFIQAPGAAESCVSVPAKKASRHGNDVRTSSAKQ